VICPPGKPCESVREVRSSLVIAAFAIAACGNRPRENKEPPHEPQRARRVIEPLTDRVGPLPPYAIRSDGVGPYKLGDKLSDLLERLASGPRIALFEIRGVVSRNVIRAEDDAILIGGEQGSTATFVAVVAPDVARTESGVHVGSTRDELIAAAGAPIDDPERARDPRLVVPAALPNLRAVLDGDRVAAIVVAVAPPSPRYATDCQRPAPTDKAIGSCMTSAGELLQRDGDDVAIRSADGERALANPLRLPGLVFAAPLRSADGRDELVAITRSAESDTRSWSIAAFRFEGARLIRTVEATPIYRLSSANARWIGADLRDVDLYLELASRTDGIEVGGLLTTRSQPRIVGKIRDVVVITPTQVTRRRGKSAPPEAAAAAGGAPQENRAAVGSGVASGSQGAEPKH